MARKAGDRIAESNILEKLGTGYYYWGQYHKALELHEQLVSIARELNNQQREVTWLNNLGVLHRQIGHYDQALECHEQALTLSQASDEREGELQSLVGIGVVYDDLRQFQKAMTFHQQALSISREIEDRQTEGMILYNLGVIYNDYQQLQQALELFEQALAIHREIGDRHMEARTLTSMGILYRVFGVTEEGTLKIHEMATSIGQLLGDDTSETPPPPNLEGYTQKAFESYEEALRIWRELGNRDGEGLTLTNLGLAYSGAGQYEQAAEKFQESIRIREELGVLVKAWRAQRGLAEVEVHRKHPETAITYYEQALASIETLRAGLAEEDYRLAFMQDKLYVYDELIALLQTLHQQYPDKGYDRKALEVFERKQGRVLLEQLGKTGTRRFAGLPEEISQKELDLETRLAQTREQLAEERANAAKAQNLPLIQELEQRENTLKVEQTALREQLKSEYPSYYALKYPQPVTAENLQQHVLQPDDVMFVYDVMRDQTILWVVSREMFQMHALPVGKDALLKHILELRQAMASELSTNRGLSVTTEQPKSTPSARSFVDISYELYTLLVPITLQAKLTEEQTLNIVPTEGLYLLPFEMLVTQQVESLQEARYLIEDVPISYLSSASLLSILRETKARQTTTPQYPLLAFADPTYESSSAPGNQRGLQAVQTQVYTEFMRNGFTPLPETAEEVETIADLLSAPEESEPIHTGENARREKLFQLNVQDRLDDYEYLVFATHGILPGDVDQIRQPALVLSYPGQEGFLTMSDVFQLKLNARLVSLSACNTGMGKYVGGEGIMGLTRAFMYAGTPAIAVTLWPVETFSAKELDIGFFEHLREGLSPARALRSIKLRMLRSEKGDTYTVPYYWAPFVLFGDGK
jgi:CHAT domain-containing protein/Tfp pilus assembly protein PilF